MTEILVQPPAAASRRAYLRETLPVIYREDDFAMRFLEGLETVLDPIVALLDSLPAHFDLDSAPPDLVRVIGLWLGLDAPAALHPSPERNEVIQRRLSKHATRIVRARGTRAGLMKLLQLAFPAYGIKVIDSGGVTESGVVREPEDAPEPSFTVITTRVDHLRQAERAVLRRVIRCHSPVHVRAWLQIGRHGTPVPLDAEELTT